MRLNFTDGSSFKIGQAVFSRMSVGGDPIVVITETSDSMLPLFGWQSYDSGDITKRLVNTERAAIKISKIGGSTPDKDTKYYYHADLSVIPEHGRGINGSTYSGFGGSDLYSEYDGIGFFLFYVPPHPQMLDYPDGMIVLTTTNTWANIDEPNERKFTPADNNVGVNFIAYNTQHYNDFLESVSGGFDPKPDPKFPGDDNENDPSGGDGDGEVEDEPVDVPEDPTISAANAGLLTLYTPTQSQIHNFGSYLWSDSFSLDTFKKLFSDPMEAVIGLSIVPVNVPTAGSQNITIGVTDSGVAANRAASQFVRVDCGTIHVKPVWNTALDFAPYTKISVFLPFIGTKDLNTDDVMDKDVNITYLVDILSGSCTAHIKSGGSVLYQFSGSCTTPIPISALNWSNLVTSSIGLLAGGTAAAAAGGVAGGVALGAMTAGAVARSKPTIQRSGNVSGAAGMLGVKVPYLIRETPRQSLAKDFAHYYGYPSNITSLLGDLKGYTVVQSMHLKNISATGDELDEIENLLKEGVLL